MRVNIGLSQIIITDAVSLSNLSGAKDYINKFLL